MTSSNWHSHRVNGAIMYQRKSDDTSYEGQWSGGEPHGHGTCVWKSGRSYTGQFHAGQPHGRGTLCGIGGTECSGVFTQGKPSGYVTITKKGHTLYQGDFLEWEQERRKCRADA
mmetsp:Transcript_9492/g.21060  ORF Transcript_9492/g.21060 Transcript_9492/m.21060 type:complete len:114 (+) Transcript_9492:122-463(+)|eukprot:3245752-Amphidinium_carterae.1